MSVAHRKRSTKPAGMACAHCAGQTGSLHTLTKPVHEEQVVGYVMLAQRKPSLPTSVTPPSAPTKRRSKTRKLCKRSAILTPVAGNPPITRTCRKGRCDSDTGQVTSPPGNRSSTAGSYKGRKMSALRKVRYARWHSSILSPIPSGCGFSMLP